MVKEESIDILRSAKEALDSLNKKKIEKSIDLISIISRLSRVEIEQLLQKVQVESDIKKTKILFFDIIAKAAEIKLYALKAKYAIVKKKYSIVKTFLRKIIELEKTEIKDITKINKFILYKKANLWDRTVLETAFIFFTRNRIQPFISDLSTELDLFFKQKKALEKNIRKKLPGHKFQKFEEDIKKDIFEREQILLRDDSLANEIKHPLIIPHHDTKISFARILGEYTYITMLGVMSYSILTKSFFQLIKKFNSLKKIQNLYAKLAFDFDSDYDMFVIDIKKITRDIIKLNKKLIYLNDKTYSIRSKKAMKDLLSDYERFLQSSRRKLKKCIDSFELESQKIHDSIVRYVIKEREKLQDVLKRAELS